MKNQKLNIKKLDKIAIMTSGGDSPGMNMVISALLKLLYSLNKESYIVYDGLYGLIHNKIKKFNYEKYFSFSDSIFLSGTLIRSSRVPKFKEEKNILKAVDNLKKNNIDALIVIGGDGSTRAALDLYKKGINIFVIPATIDNDVFFTEYTIGYSSALNLILSNIYAIRNTAKSFNSFCLIEVMGRECSDLSVNSSLATFADGVITKDNPWTIEDFCNKISLIKKHKKHWGIFIVTEKYYGQNNIPSYSEIVKKVEEKTHIHMKFNSVGYAQRGAQPTAEELIKAFEISKYCADSISKNETNIAFGWNGGKIIKHDLSKNIKKIDHSKAELNTSKYQ